jgi:hypothetical protein
MDKKKTRDKLEELRKQTDDWKNNQFAASGAVRDIQQLLPLLPQKFKNFRRDKDKEIDPGKAFLGKNKRKHNGRNYNKGRKKYNKENVRKFI